MTNLKNKTLFVSGASRGIGLAIAKRAAHDGANIILAAKTAEPHPKLPGTIYTAAEEIVEACLLYTSPSPRDMSASRMPSSA